MSDPMNPSPTLLVKLGSAVVHADEFLSPGGHPFDRDAFNAMLADPEVRDWLAVMSEAALLPLRRDA